MTQRFDRWGTPLDRDPMNSRFVEPLLRTRTKQDYPYSYDAFFLWGGHRTIKGSEAVYSDRLQQWDRDKFRKCWEAFPDMSWTRLTPEAVGKWMSMYLGYEVTATALAEGCNQSNGYPYWIIWFKKKEG